MNDSIIFKTDSYKVSHHVQYPPDTTLVSSYFESRGGQFDSTVFFGLQYILKRHLEGRRVLFADIQKAKKLFKQHFFGNDALFNEAGWLHIALDHDGYLPVSIKAVKEGTVVPTSNVLMTVENTCPKCYWLTNYLETLLVQVWYPMTVATQGREIKKIIRRYLSETTDLPSVDGADYKLHDFGYRGVSSDESAGIGGLAHLVNFRGTDNIKSLLFAEEAYGATEVAGNSIPAAEHSTITSWGPLGEPDAYLNMLQKYPTGFVAVVSDSYDLGNAVDNIWGGQLKSAVLERNGVLVIRPDSGYPAHVVLDTVHRLARAFGYSVNNKNYKVLNPKVRVIQGDGVNITSIDEILRTLKGSQYSTDNIAFGMGGALLQQLNRDTQRCAFKCCYIEGDGWQRDVFKRPATDVSKASKAGRLALVSHDGKIMTIPAPDPAGNDLLVEVFRNGRLLVDQDFDAVRRQANV